MAEKQAGEKELSASFQDISRIANFPGSHYKHFDFHAITQGTNFSAINPYAEILNKFL